ncbi:hypothetical protein MLD52_21845 [Puniceicoccaceae bacterium K14]|nr:hypothetical protein [Puniceicoccaceae bacterium K14]
MPVSLYPSHCIFFHKHFAATIRISDEDFSHTFEFSNVSTYDFKFNLDTPLQAGLISDPPINNIQYSVSGDLGNGTPSGFSAFAFQLDHIFELSPPISGNEFYALNSESSTGSTLQFSVSATADLSDGLQVSELEHLSFIQSHNWHA